MRFYGVVMVAVTELIVTIVAGLFIGRWADQQYQTGNRYLIIGTLSGSVLGFVRLILRLQKVVNDPSNK